MDFWLALQFLTRIPVRIKAWPEEKNMARSMIFYPAVGLLLGGLAAAVHFLFSLAFASPVADLAVIVFLVLITGNMHLDGFMDTADGLFSGKAPQEALLIMRDSRVGSHGVVAGFIMLLARLVLLNQVPLSLKTGALLLMPLWGRWSLVYAAALFPYLRGKQGTGSFTAQVGRRELALASIFTLVVYVFILIFFLSLPEGLLMALIILAGTTAFSWYIFRRLGGMTGDTMGALNECTEVLLLLALLLFFITP